MYAELLGDTTLYEILQRIDEDLAAQARSAGCTCGGRLHSVGKWGRWADLPELTQALAPQG